MNVYVYDGSFEGLLCALSKAMDGPETVGDILPETAGDADLFSDRATVMTDDRQAEDFIRRIRERCSDRAARNVYYTYLSELPGMGMLLFSYLKLAFARGRDIDRQESEPVVLEVHRIRNKVAFEAHRLTGLIRFRKLKGDFYYSPIEPDHNVLNLLIGHFRARFGNQKWMIHDRKRGLAVIYNGKNWKVVEADLENEELIRPIGGESAAWDSEEKIWQDLWKLYYRTIAIEDRKNPRLQKRLMPVRYWKNLIEKDDL